VLLEVGSLNTIWLVGFGDADANPTAGEQGSITNRHGYLLDSHATSCNGWRVRHPGGPEWSPHDVETSRPSPQRNGPAEKSRYQVIASTPITWQHGSNLTTSLQGSVEL